MKFTWWTYHIAIKRAFNEEYYFFSMNQRAFAGPDKWYKAMRFTEKLRDRRITQKKLKKSAGRKLYKKQGGPW